MQSGITVSSALQESFNTFVSDPSLFALPVTITGESITPLAAQRWTSNDFESSLPSLSSHLQPKTPIYLILRRSPNESTGFVAVTYVPSIAPVRSKMLFASSRAALVRDLGAEKFGDSVFATDPEEVLEVKQWEQRSKTASAVGSGGNTDILTEEERELQSVRRAEEEARHGTSGRDLMGEGGSGGALKMKVADGVKAAFGELSSDGAFVQLGIQTSSETIELLDSKSGVQPAQVQGSIPSDRPSYSFYRYPGADAVVFIYTCPGSSKVRERMMYASSRNGVLELAKGEGVNVTKRLEAGGPEEVDEARLAQEVDVGAGSASSQPAAKQGFARPKRPGKR